MRPAGDAPVKPGDVVRVRPDAEATFDALRGCTAEVVEVRTIGGRTWAQLDVEGGVPRVTWLPAERLQAVEQEAAT